MTWPQRPGLVAGRDLEAGGTWLGMRHGSGGPLLAGLLNRRGPDGPLPVPAGARSRGLLCLDALALESAADGASLFARSPAPVYAGFNLLIADPDHAVVWDNAGEVPRATELATGLSVLTNLDLNDPRCVRLATARKLFAAAQAGVAAARTPADLVAVLAPLLGDHEASLDAAEAPLARLCVHAGPYGTRSSSIVGVGRDGEAFYYHAAGPPCRTRFEPVAL